MATNCYQNHKQKPPKERREKYQNLSKQEKDKKWKKDRERYQNLTEEEEEKGVIRIFLRKKRSKS